MKRSQLALVSGLLAAALTLSGLVWADTAVKDTKPPVQEGKLNAATPEGSTPSLPAVTPGTAAVTPASTPAATPPKTSKSDSKKPAVVDSLVLLERAVARDSTKFDNLYRLGVMYLDRDRVSEAARVLYKAHQLRPKNYRAMVNLGAAYDAAGQPQTAQTYYKDALKLAPDDSVATCRLASSYYAQANYKDAMKLLRGMIDGAKGTGAYCAYFTLGVAFADAGIYRDAIRMWKKVIELAPNSAEANSAKESIDVLEKFVNKQ